jgi:hypothetical protein
VTVRNPSIQTTSRTWLAYIALVALLTALCFSGVADLGLDTHDADTFRDHERIAQDFSFFFSPDKEQASGRPLAEAVKYLAYLAWGNDPGIFHLLVVFFHALASLRLVMADIRNPDALDPDLRRARELFPDNMHFVIASLVLDSLGPDPQRRHEAQSRLAELKFQDTGNTYWTAQLYDNAGF